MSEPDPHAVAPADGGATAAVTAHDEDETTTPGEAATPAGDVAAVHTQAAAEEAVDPTGDAAPPVAPAPADEVAAPMGDAAPAVAPAPAEEAVAPASDVAAVEGAAPADEVAAPMGDAAPAVAPAPAEDTVGPAGDVAAVHTQAAAEEAVGPAGDVAAVHTQAAAEEAVDPTGDAAPAVAPAPAEEAVDPTGDAAPAVAPAPAEEAVDPTGDAAPTVAPAPAEEAVAPASDVAAVEGAAPAEDGDAPTGETIAVEAPADEPAVPTADVTAAAAATEEVLAPTTGSTLALSMSGRAMTAEDPAAEGSSAVATTIDRLMAVASTVDRSAAVAPTVERPAAVDTSAERPASVAPTVAPTVARPSAVAPAVDKPAEVIRTVGLTKTYRSGGRDQKDVTAVDGLDLTVCRGEIFGLLGPNGAGKTTTVGMLTTRVTPTAGKAMVNGIDVVRDPARAKYFIGVVHQVNTLDRSLTAWENLYFHGRYYGMGAAASRKRSDELLERFRLTHRAGAQVRTLSGGMARRLMVARAVMHRPAVLFLDEPTASLDPQSRIALWEIVEELHAEGQTILLTTHYMEEADRFCNRVAIIDHGKVLALDSPAALKHNAAAGRAPVGNAKAWLAHLRALERSTDTSSNGRAAPRPAPDNANIEAALIEIINAAERHGLSLDDLRGQVTLESVFIDLTGRDLRE